MVSGRYFIAWALSTAVVIILVVALSYQDWTTASDLEDTYVRKKQLLDRLTSLPKKEKIIKEQLTGLGGEAAARYLYQGEPNTVQSFLQRDIRQIASTAGISVNNMRPVALGRQNELIAIQSVQLNFATTHEQLLRFMDELRRVEPMLRVKRMSTRVQRKSTISSAAQLSVTMEVSGFRSIGSAS